MKIEFELRDITEIYVDKKNDILLEVNLIYEDWNKVNIGVACEYKGKVIGYEELQDVEIRMGIYDRDLLIESAQKQIDLYKKRIKDGCDI